MLTVWRIFVEIIVNWYTYYYTYNNWIIIKICAVIIDETCAKEKYRCNNISQKGNRNLNEL